MTVLSRRARGLVSLVLALLLLGMQQEALRHPISHFDAGHTQHELTGPQTDTRCVECFVLAEGSAALPARPVTVSAEAAEHRVIWPAHVAPALARSTSHRSRAPPSLS